ncbi:MAG: TlpA family protein disulfide reductase [Candidatus Thiodiazotropha sp. (ex Epidulcina cf. delphinae)]|nr:TlpA family protein disulfide reductase [Candidatus Thiodiazotropha sp. (ex Epidulcina cf. delphinae)]
MFEKYLMNQKSKITHYYAGRLFLAFLSVAVFKPSQAGWLEPVEPLRMAPLIELIDTKGDIYRLSTMAGKVVLVNFWATWCPPCIEEMPSLVRLSNSIDQSRFAILAVNVQEKQRRVQQFATQLGLVFPVLLDTSRQVGDAWDITVFPSSFLVDAEGRIRFKAIGPVQWDSDEVVAVVEKLLAEQDARSP